MEKCNDPQHYPWTMGLQPTFYREGFTHARYILAHKPDAKIAILHANDDSDEGVKGLKDGLGARADKLARSSCRVSKHIFGRTNPNSTLD